MQYVTKRFTVLSEIRPFHKCFFLAVIGALYLKMSIGRLIRPLVGWWVRQQRVSKFNVVGTKVFPLIEEHLLHKSLVICNEFNAM